MKTQRINFIVVCIFIASFGYPQSKSVDGIPVMNKDEYSWCSRQIFEISVDSLAKTYNSYFKESTETANTEYRNKSKLFIDELSNMISLGKMKAYSYEGNPLTFSDVNAILSKNVMVKEVGTEKVKKGLQKQNITSFRIIEDVYINKKTLKIEAKLLALLPIAAVFTNDGELKGTMPLFYIYF